MAKKGEKKKGKKEVVPPPRINGGYTKVVETGTTPKLPGASDFVQKQKKTGGG